MLKREDRAGIRKLGSGPWEGEGPGGAGVRGPYQRKGLKSQERSNRVYSLAGGGQGSPLGCWGSKKVLEAGNGLHPRSAAREQGGVLVAR